MNGRDQTKNGTLTIISINKQGTLTKIPMQHHSERSFTKKNKKKVKNTT